MTIAISICFIIALIFILMQYTVMRDWPAYGHGIIPATVFIILALALIIIDWIWWKISLLFGG